MAAGEDVIGIDNLDIQCVIGCNPDERSRKQFVRVSLKLRGSTALCGRTDNLEDTIDYSKVSGINAHGKVAISL
jgi:dihydroneopterin aldolase